MCLVQQGRDGRIGSSGEDERQEGGDDPAALVLDDGFQPPGSLPCRRVAGLAKDLGIARVLRQIVGIAGKDVQGAQRVEPDRRAHPPLGAARSRTRDGLRRAAHREQQGGEQRAGKHVTNLGPEKHGRLNGCDPG